MGRMNKKIIPLCIVGLLLISSVFIINIVNERMDKKELCENIKQNYPEKLGFYVELNEIELVERDRFLKECENGY